VGGVQITYSLFRSRHKEDVLSKYTVFFIIISAILTLVSPYKNRHISIAIALKTHRTINRFIQERKQSDQR